MFENRENGEFFPRARGFPEKAQEPLELHGKEADVLQAFGEAAQKPTKESLEEFMVNLRDLVGEYEASGMSFPEATQKASAFFTIH